MLTKHAVLFLAAVLPFLLGACALLDSGSELLNVAKVEFSEGSPAVDGQTVAYTGGLLSTPIPAFSVEGGSVSELEFPIEIPLTLIDKVTIRKIIDGDPIPYFLSGTLSYEVFQGTTLEGAGKTEVDLTSGEISTRPSGSVTTLLSGLL